MTLQIKYNLWITSKVDPGYEICITSHQVNLSSEMSAMFNSLMPSLNSRSLPFVVFLGGFPSRCQNLSSGALRPGGLLSQIRFDNFFVFFVYSFLGMILINCQEMDFIELFKRSFSSSERSGLAHFPIIISSKLKISGILCFGLDAICRRTPRLVFHVTVTPMHVSNSYMTQPLMT